MKTRTSLVSNSSSTSFVITNNSDKELTIVDFAKENLHLIDDFLNRYNWHRSSHFNSDAMINSAVVRLKQDSDKYTFKSKQSKILTFGDEHGDTIGHVYDYMLRNGGQSKNFEWSFYEYNR